MSYSRRQLYAFGEPLGDSVTRKEGGRVVYGDGGGGQSSSGTTTQISELPDWAKGYAKDTLAKTGALTDISQNPYKPYEGNRIAGFSPLQTQSQQNAANMQTSGATGFGTQLAGAAGLGALGARYDPTQFQAGEFGGDAAQRYMSPYMQNVVDIQQREAQRQGDIAGTQLASQATKSGAFGGGRQAIMEAEAARNLATQKGDIQARGLQSSYDQAQAQFNADQARRMQAQQLAEQSKQYGAGYGMQGLQTALQGAGQLGTLGGQEFAQGMDINKLQNAYGGQQQALQQQGLSQAYQDFQNQQNYPYKQLGFMSDMIRGLPLGQQSTKQVYEAEPGLGSQLIGAGTAAYGLSKFMAEGGITGDANVSNILSKLSDAQLEQAKQSAMEREDINQVNMIVAEQQERAQTRSGISAAAPEQGGIASAASDEMMDRMLPTEASMARGGIVAFAAPDADNNYSLVTDPQFGGSTGEIAEDRPKPTRDQVNAIVQALRDSGQPIGLSDIMDIEAGKITAPSEAADAVAAPAAIPDEGLGGTPKARQAAVLPPDISTMGGGAGRDGGGGGGRSTDFGAMYDAARARIDKAPDPYAEETRQLGDEGVRQAQAKKERLVADQAKQANVFSERKNLLEERSKAIGKREAINEGMALISMGAAIMSEPGRLGKSIGKGIKVGSEQYIAGMDKIERSKELLADAREKLADLERDRSDMSLKEIRAAEDEIGGAQLSAKKMLLQGRKDLGVRNDAKSLAVFESEVKQQLAREAQKAHAANMNKPGETERMMTQLGAIQSGKASFAGKTGDAGVQAFQESLGQIGAGKYGARYTGPDKGQANAIALEKLMQGDNNVKLLDLENFQLRKKTDKASQAKLAANSAEIETIRNRYRAAMPSGGGAATTLPKSVTTGGKTYARPANFSDAQWSEYVKSVGAE